VTEARERAPMSYVGQWLAEVCRVPRTAVGWINVGLG
jgi:hypothetical protein